MSLHFIVIFIQISSDNVKVSLLEIPENLTKTVSCDVSGVYPRPVFSWAGHPGLGVLEEAEVELMEDIYLLTSSSRLRVTGTRDNNNTLLSCTVDQIRRLGKLTTI